MTQCAASHANGVEESSCAQAAPGKSDIRAYTTCPWLFLTLIFALCEQPVGQSD